MARRKAPALVWLLAVLLTGLHCASSTSGSSIDAAGLDSLMTKVVREVDPSVVFIQTANGLGSGEIYDTAGDIVTNAHVVGTATALRVTLYNGRQLAATLVGTYPPDDVAVIRVSGNGLEPATFGDSSKLEVGQTVLAIGNPLGLQGSVTSGVVSAVNRQVSEGTTTLPDAIQTSAAINPGNSGGALVDLESRVVGIPTLAALSPAAGSAGAQAPGIGFAISSNRARFIADQLVKHGTVTNPGRA